MIKKKHRSFFDSLWHHLQRKISQNGGAQVTANQDHAGALSVEFVSRKHILRASEPANTRRLHATDFATTSAINVPATAKPANAEPPRLAFTKLVVVLARFCRIATIEHVSFVRFFDGKRGINAATSCLHRHLLRRSSEPYVDHT